MRVKAVENTANHIKHLEKQSNNIAERAIKIGDTGWAPP